MPLITDWLMVGITLVYVVATIMICVFNGRSAKATREQVSESQRQFEETKRLGYRPYFDILPADNNFEYNIYDTEITLHMGCPKWQAHSSVLAWRIPWTEKPGRLQSMGSHRVRHD